jgi:hypothetical protein
VGIGEKPLRLHRLGVTVFEMLIKNRTRVIETKLKDSLANLKSEFSSKTTVQALGQLVSFNSKRERKIALKMARKFSLNLPLVLRRKVQTFQAAVRAKAAEFAVSCWGDFFLCVTHSVQTSTSLISFEPCFLESYFVFASYQLHM